MAWIAYPFRFLELLAWVCDPRSLRPFATLLLRFGAIPSAALAHHDVRPRFILDPGVLARPQQWESGLTSARRFTRGEARRCQHGMIPLFMLFGIATHLGVLHGAPDSGGRRSSDPARDHSNVATVPEGLGNESVTPLRFGRPDCSHVL